MLIYLHFRLATWLRLLNIMCWLKWMPWIPLFWVLAMLVVDFSCFAICTPHHSLHCNYLPTSLCLHLIRGTCQKRFLWVHSFFVGRILRWWCTRYIVNGKIFSWQAHEWPLRCTDWSWTMSAQVNYSLQVVQSSQVVACLSAILGDIVDSEPRVGSCQIVSFCR